MTKKKDETPEVDPRAPVESVWGGVAKWDCPFPNCGRDSFDRSEVEAHIAHAHPERALSVTEALALERTDLGGSPVSGPPDAPSGESATDTPDKTAKEGE